MTVVFTQKASSGLNSLELERVESDAVPAVGELVHLRASATAPGQDRTAYRIVDRQWDFSGTGTGTLILETVPADEWKAVGE